MNSSTSNWDTPRRSILAVVFFAAAAVALVTRGVLSNFASNRIYPNFVSLGGDTKRIDTVGFLETPLTGRRLLKVDLLMFKSRNGYTIGEYVLRYDF
jgi:hypothetical protein